MEPLYKRVEDGTAASGENRTMLFIKNPDAKVPEEYKDLEDLVGALIFREWGSIRRAADRYAAKAVAEEREAIACMVNDYEMAQLIRARGT